MRRREKEKVMIKRIIKNKRNKIKHKKNQRMQINLRNPSKMKILFKINWLKNDNTLRLLI